MTDDGLIAFGRGRYLFRLPLPRAIEVERLCGGKALGTMYEELSAGIGLERDTDVPRYLGCGPIHPKDVYEIIRCAAIGGGQADIAGESVAVSAIDAAQLVNEYVADGEPGRYAEAIPVAWLILHRTFRDVSLKKKVEVADDTSHLTAAE